MDLPLNLAKFFQPSRLFHLRPYIFMSTIYFLLIVFGALIVVSIIVKLIQKSKSNNELQSRLYGMYFKLFLIPGLIGLVLVWLRYERVYILSARFWLLLWFVGFIAGLAYIFKFQFKEMPRSLEQSQKSKIFAQYLPKKK